MDSPCAQTMAQMAAGFVLGPLQARSLRPTPPPRPARRLLGFGCSGVALASCSAGSPPEENAQALRTFCCD